MTALVFYLAGGLAIGLLLYFSRGRRNQLWQPTVPRREMSQRKAAVRTQDASGNRRDPVDNAEQTYKRDKVLVH